MKWFAACGLTEEGVSDLVLRILAGERPFEDWMYAHGYSRKDVADVYQVIDHVVDRAWDHCAPTLRSESELTCSRGLPPEPNGLLSVCIINEDKQE